MTTQFIKFSDFRINAIRNMKQRLIEVKPIMDEYGTIYQKLFWQDYVTYAILRGANPSKAIQDSAACKWYIIECLRQLDAGHLPSRVSVVLLDVSAITVDDMAELKEAFTSALTKVTGDQ